MPKHPDVVLLFTIYFSIFSWVI